MSLQDIVAIIPIRFLPSLKHRLAQSMDESQRKKLVKSMLADEIKAIGQSEMITRIVIVTSDEDLLIANPPPRFEIYRSVNQGLNRELTEYIKFLSRKGKGHALIILGDLPLITGAVLDEIIWSGLRSHRPVIAKDWKGLGTNVFFFSYPPTFKLHFGKNSFEKHLYELESKGAYPIIYHAMETALDIDDDASIHQLLVLSKLDKKIKKLNTYLLLQEDEK